MSSNTDRSLLSPLRSPAVLDDEHSALSGNGDDSQSLQPCVSPVDAYLTSKSDRRVKESLYLRKWCLHNFETKQLLLRRYLLFREKRFLGVVFLLAGQFIERSGPKIIFMSKNT